MRQDPQGQEKMLIRYPGGKRWLAHRVSAMLPMGASLCEPFAGAAHIGWEFLRTDGWGRLWLNDYDPGIVALWETVVSSPDELCDEIRAEKPTPELFYRLRDELAAGTLTGIDLALGKLVIHQISYSGLGEKAGSPIGGKGQKGAYPVDCRWNPDRLIRQVRLLAVHAARVKVTRGSWDQMDIDEDWWMYVDPPYIEAGESLYRHGTIDHKALAEWLQERDRWILSYDDHPDVLDLYDGWTNIEKVGMRGTITEKRQMQELLITPR